MGSITATSKPTIDVSNVEILSFTVTDLRFPTSLDGVGSDAMHVGTNGSHPYIRLITNHPNLIGEGIVSIPSHLISSLSFFPHQKLLSSKSKTLTKNDRHSATAAAAN